MVNPFTAGGVDHLGQANAPAGEGSRQGVREPLQLLFAQAQRDDAPLQVLTSMK